MASKLTIRLDAIDAVNLEELKEQTKQATASKAIRMLLKDYSTLYLKIGKLRAAMTEIKIQAGGTISTWQDADTLLQKISEIASHAEFNSRQATGH